MEYFVGFVLSFIIIYTFYLLTVILQKKKYDRFKKSNQVMYFVKKYKISVNKIDIGKFIKIISFTNSLIIALCFTLVFKINNNILMLLAGLSAIIPLTLISYHFIGRYLQREAK